MRVEKAYFPLSFMCRMLEVSRSGYYAWLERKPSRRQLVDQKLLPVIAQVHEQGRRAYGSPRVTQELKRRNHP